MRRCTKASAQPRQEIRDGSGTRGAENIVRGSQAPRGIMRVYTFERKLTPRARVV